MRPDRSPADEPKTRGSSPRVRDRLMSIIEQTTVEPQRAWQPPAIYPRLGYLDERGPPSSSLPLAFGFRERVEARRENEGNVLAWLEHGDGVVMVGHVQHDVHGIHSPRETGHGHAHAERDRRGRRRSPR